MVSAGWKVLINLTIVCTVIERANKRVPQALYGILGLSQAATNRVYASTGAAFMVAEGYLVSAAHIAHNQNNPENPVHQRPEAIRAPDIGAPGANLVFVVKAESCSVFGHA